MKKRKMTKSDSMAFIEIKKIPVHEPTKDTNLPATLSQLFSRAIDSIDEWIVALTKTEDKLYEYNGTRREELIHSLEKLSATAKGCARINQEFSRSLAYMAQRLREQDDAE